MSRIKLPERSSPEISLAPLIDCVLLLFIFFLLTSSFARDRQMEIELPESTASEETATSVIRITVEKGGDIEIDGTPITGVPHMLDTLSRAAAEHDDKEVLLIADRRVSLEEVIAVLDCASDAGLGTVSIATRPAESDAGNVEQ